MKPYLTILLLLLFCHCSNPPAEEQQTATINYEVEFDKAFDAEEDEKAINIAKKWTAAEPNNPEAFLALGKVHYFNQKYNKAVQAFEKWKKLAPNDASAYFFTALAYKLMRHYYLAKENILKAINIAPDNTRYLESYASICGQLGEYQQAVDLFSKVIATNPDDFFIYGSRGNAYRYLNDMEAAQKDFAKALALFKKKPNYQSDPELIHTHILILEGLLDFEQVQQLCNKLIKLQPNNGNYYLSRAVYKTVQRNWEAALDDLKKAEELGTREGDEVLLTKMYALIKLENWEEALFVGNQLIDISPHYGLAYANRAIIYSHQEQLDKAEEDLQKAFDYSPNHPYIYKVQAIVELAKGDKNKACSSLNKAIDRGYNLVYFDGQVNELVKQHCK